MKYSSSQISAISRLFSSGVFREMARAGKSPLFARLAREIAPLSEALMTAPVSRLFDEAFRILKMADSRHEYIYKAALTHKVLLGTHSLQTASMLHEFRVRDCKADVAIFNGTATVYEIKSERDSLTRLDRQVDAYRKFFAKVYVIAGENHINGILAAVPREVGILKLSSRYSISMIRDASDCAGETSPTVIFESVRTEEAKTILTLSGVAVPDVPNTEMHVALRERFEGLDPCETHRNMVRTLKVSRSLMPLSSLVSSLPNSLQSAALSMPLRRADHERLTAAVRTPLPEALQWG